MSPACPKPTKADRRTAKTDKKAELVAYRHGQVRRAIYRDDDWCIFCWFRFGRKRRRAEIHHVYGRGTEAGDWREQYTSLACTCKECHPLPIKTPGANPDLAWVEECLQKANETPINPAFRGEDNAG